MSDSDVKDALADLVIGYSEDASPVEGTARAAILAIDRLEAAIIKLERERDRHIALLRDAGIIPIQESGS